MRAVLATLLWRSSASASRQRNPPPPGETLTGLPGGNTIRKFQKER
jgi:hypothetical protein